MPATYKVLIWCIHNENPFEHNLWWLHCGFVKEMQILNSSMESTKLHTSAMWLTPFQRNLRSFFPLLHRPTCVLSVHLSLLPLCGILHHQGKKHSNFVVSQKYHWNYINVKIQKTMWMSLGIISIISIQSMHTSHKTSQNERVNLQNIRVFVHLWDSDWFHFQLEHWSVPNAPKFTILAATFKEFWALKLAIENDLWDFLNWIFSMTCRNVPSFAKIS